MKATLKSVVLLKNKIFDARDLLTANPLIIKMDMDQYKINATLLLACLPFSVLLDSKGCVSPKPMASTLLPSTPFETK
jgi:hypothetical protein